MFRVLLLSSTIGFLANSCWMKMVAAQLVALAFLVVFVIAKPYKRNAHFVLQLLAMSVPVASSQSIFCRALL